MHRTDWTGGRTEGEKKQKNREEKTKTDQFMFKKYIFKRVFFLKGEKRFGRKSEKAHGERLESNTKM